MSRFEPVAPALMNDEQRELYESLLDSPRDRSRVVTEDGRLRGPFDPLLRSPAIGLPLHKVGAAIRYSTELAPAHRELAILATAAEWRCDHEWNAHLPLAEDAGLDRAELEPLRDGTASFEDPILRLIHDAVREVLQDRTMSEATFDHLADALGERQLFELLALIGYYSALAVITNSLDIR